MDKKNLKPRHPCFKLFICKTIKINTLISRSKINAVLKLHNLLNYLPAKAGYQQFR